MRWPMLAIAGSCLRMALQEVEVRAPPLVLSLKPSQTFPRCIDNLAPPTLPHNGGWNERLRVGRLSN